jgi:hypothetical protein
MDLVVHPPVERRPMSPSEYPRIPTVTPSAIIKELLALCASGDIQKFLPVLDSVQPSSFKPKEFVIRELWTVINEAIKRDGVSFIEELLHRGLPMNYRYAVQAIHFKAAELGKVDVVRFLLSEGVATKIKDANNRTALGWAENLNHTGVVEVLKSPD